MVKLSGEKTEETDTTAGRGGVVCSSVMSLEEQKPEVRIKSGRKTAFRLRTWRYVLNIMGLEGSFSLQSVVRICNYPHIPKGRKEFLK